MRIFIFIQLLVAPFLHSLEKEAIYCEKARFHPIYSEHGMVSSQEAVASQIGLAILEKGGNAVDASIAVAFALAVTLPRAGNLGGGGFMLLHVDDQTHAIDYRETAPEKAHRNMFLTQDGDANLLLSQSHGLSVGVPGTVAGMALAHKRWGSLDWKVLIEPAIELALCGIEVTASLSDALHWSGDRLKRWESSRRIFFKPDGTSYQPGEVLVQCDLGNTLELIANQGPEVFYQGVIAKKIIAEVVRQGGVLKESDLRRYQAVVRKPLWGTYRQCDIAAMPPPSSGGIHIIQALNILEAYPMQKMGQNSALTIHLIVEALKHVHADRSLHLGDSDFVPVPLKGLINKQYAAQQRKKILFQKALPSKSIQPGNPSAFESEQTTHFSVADRFGNVVSNTYTLNFSYGSGLVAEGTGIILNNEMDDFSIKPGVANGYGLIGGEANAVEAGKRPLSSMSPTIVFKDGKPFLITGSPGGSRIIATVLQMILNVIDFKMNIAEATNAPRVHHQWQPDEIRIESGLSVDTIHLLEQRGHKISCRNAMGSTQSILIEENRFSGASDPRRPGALTIGY